jgi:hypothetical protein
MEIFIKTILQNNSVFVLQYNSDTGGNDMFCIIIYSQHVKDVYITRYVSHNSL